MRLKTTISVSILAMFVVLTVAAPVFAQKTAKGHESSITVFDVPGNVVGTEPTAINEGGAIAGYYWDENGVFHGFTRTPGGHLTTFDAPGAGTALPWTGTFPMAINQAGEVTGQVTDDDYVTHGFIRTPGGHFVTFDAPGAGGPGQGTAPAAINLSGEVAGWYIDAGNVNHGFVRAPDGTITVFDVPGAGTGEGQGTSTAMISTITLDGSVTGTYSDDSGLYHGWLRKGDGTITTFDAPGAGTDGSQGQGTVPNVINELGEIGGAYVDAANVQHPFLRAPDGSFTTFDVPGASRSVVKALNAYGVAAGTWWDPVAHGFVRATDGTITAFDPTGSEWTVVNAINDHGAITGSFENESGAHGFVRTTHP